MKTTGSLPKTQASCSAVETREKSGVPVEAQVQNAVMRQFLHAVGSGTIEGQRERVLRGGAECAGRPALLLDMAEAARD